jgi:hypothetical protein
MISDLAALSRSQIQSLVAGFICMLIYGSAYTYGTLIPYVTSYIFYESTPLSIQAMNRSPPTRWLPSC